MIDYRGLGDFLAAAGGDPERAERIVQELLLHQKGTRIEVSYLEQMRQLRASLDLRLADFAVKQAKDSEIFNCGMMLFRNDVALYHAAFAANVKSMRLYMKVIAGIQLTILLVMALLVKQSFCWS
ncbi:hypothetical protein [Novosphingobium album (ex Liu et al. 2023)]|uniref:hypothetical protein n=1 Tax=Novosphingobium album (ex Liu et al. 2023) TaxID=3031130 RepID=UPI0023AFCC82|nr:hypothetical protein [Novosphingobium album (ex Liu et al. 2023)]